MTPEANNECPFCHVEHTVAVPCVHSNGTSAEELRDLLDAAVKDVRSAISRVHAAAPNGRDYYVKSPELIGHVMRQHNIRLEKLAEVAAELVQMRDHVMEVIEFKAEAKARRWRAIP